MVHLEKLQILHQSLEIEKLIKWIQLIEEKL